VYGVFDPENRGMVQDGHIVTMDNVSTV